MPPTWGQVRQFCLRRGYRETGTNRYRHVKPLPDRSISGTLVSLGADSQGVPASLRTRVWCRQLHLAGETEFWHGLEGASVAYDSSPAPVSAPTLPDYLVRFLKGTLDWTDEQVAATTREQAQELLNDYYARELEDS